MHELHYSFYSITKEGREEHMMYYEVAWRWCTDLWVLSITQCKKGERGRHTQFRFAKENVTKEGGTKSVVKGNEEGGAQVW